MSIATKKGDDGTTGLWSGERRDKDDPRVEAYGTLDELDALLGEAKHWLKLDESKRLVEEVQKDLYRLSGELASLSRVFPGALSGADEERLSAYVARYEEAIRLKGFVLQGSTVQSAKIDIARTVARRAERRICALAKREPVSDSALCYINRLSDVLFMLARAEEEAAGGIRYVKG